jgi:hypothetical protein
LTSLAPAPVFVLAAALAAAVPALAQEPVKSFDQLGTRLVPGDTVFVTDSQGREVKGRVLRVTPSSLTLDGGRGRTFDADEVRAVRERTGHSLDKAALWGTAAGAGIGLAAALAGRGEFATSCTPEQAAAGCWPPPGVKPPIDWWAVPIWAGIGGAFGALVGAVLPGKFRDVFVAPAAAAGGTRARASGGALAFDQLNTRLKPGDSVWLTDADGREIEGTIVGLGPGSLQLEAEGAGRDYPASRVQAIRIRRRDSIRDGVIIGAAAGFAGGAASCLANPECSGDEAAAGVTIGLAIVGAAAGVAIGAAIDAAVKGPTLVVYQRPGAGAQARFSITPLIAPHAKGVAVSFAF